ncbi:PEP-CTERM sorting domain-containing protein [Poriferisphaera sp. WC338]|uniref:PEP-CTERM sorting domain-containing protein n=1 Tax=Poriferisphaera sp. WC338 TaxID=3425129 RepID=UPI003D817509
MPVLKQITKSATALIALLSLITAPLHADIAFSESDFENGTYTVGQMLTTSPPEPGSSFAVSSSRFTAQGHGNFILQQFQLYHASGDFNFISQPIFVNDFVYDTQTEGAIESLSASMKVFPVANNLAVTVGHAYLIVEQNDRFYRGYIDGFFTNIDETTFSLGNMTETDFIEFSDTGLNGDSHPDFDSGQLRFGFSTAMSNTGLSYNENYLLISAFDDLNIRIDSAPVPEPASLSLLSLGTLALLRRTHR